MNYFEEKMRELGLISPAFNEKNTIKLKKANLNDKKFKQAGIPIKVTKDNTVYYPDELCNSICIGSSGSGKSTCVTSIYALENLKAGNNMIIVDVKNELWSITSQKAKELGYDCQIINFFDKSHSHHYNPLYLATKLIRSDDANQKDDGFASVAEFAESMKEKQVSDIFWENSSASTIEGVIDILCKYGPDSYVPSMVDVIRILSEGREKIRTQNYLNEYVSEFVDDETIKSLLSSYLSAGFETRGSIDSVLSEKISRFCRSDKLLDLLSDMDINMEKLSNPNYKFAIYLSLPDYTSLYNTIVSIIIRQLYVKLQRDSHLKYNGKLPRKVCFLLEEFSQYHIKDFEHIWCTSRSRNIEFLICIQSLTQLNDAYGLQAAKTITDNSMVMIYLYSSDLDTLDKISKLSGNKMEIIKGQEVVKPRISVNDLLVMPKFHGVVVMNRKRSFYTTFKPYYECDLNLDISGVPLPNTRKRVDHKFSIKEAVNIRREEKMKQIFGFKDEIEGTQYRHPFDSEDIE